MAEEDVEAAAEDAEVAEGVPTAVVEAARVEWEEAAVEVATTGLRFRAEAIVVGAAIVEEEAADGPHRGPLGGTVQVAWPRIETRPEETLTGLRPPRKFNLVPMAPGELFLRLLKEGVEQEGVEPPGPATKGFPMWVEERVLVNSRGEVKALRVTGSKVPRAVRFLIECRVVNWARWQEARLRGAWRAPVSLILVEAIWAAEVSWAAEASLAA